MAKTKGQEESALKRMILYAGLVAAALMMPARPVQLGKMKPVEVVQMTEVGGQIELKTDTGDTGTGETVLQALTDLKETAPGIIYLDTAEYLLVSENSGKRILELQPYLKKHIYIVEVSGEVELGKVAEFLGVHKPSVQLKDWQEGLEMEKIRQEKEKLIFEEKR